MARSLLTLACAAAAWTSGHCQPADATVEVFEQVMAPQALGRACAPREATDWIAAQMRQRPVRIAPADCQVSADNPPVFVWPTPARAGPRTRYDWALADASGQVVARRHTEVPYLYLSEPLPRGDYAWRVTATLDGTDEAVSDWRRVRVSSESTPVPLPTAQEVLRTATGQHRPRLLSRGAARRAGQAPAACAPMSDAVLARARRDPRGDGVVPEPAPKRDAADDHRIHQAAVAARRAIVTLAVCGQLAGRDDWLDAARERLIALAAWNPLGATSEASQDQANREVLLTLAIGYDLLQGRLDDAQRSAVLHSALARMQQQHQGAFAGLRSGRHPYDSHGINGATMAAAAAVLLVGEGDAFEPMALDYIGWLVPNLLPWVDEAGADGASHAYGWFNLVTTLPPVTVLSLATGLDLSRRAPLRHAPRWIEAFTPPVATGRRTVMTFGDGSDTRFGYVHHFRSSTLATLAALQGSGAAAAVSPDAPGGGVPDPEDPPVDPLVWLLAQAPAAPAGSATPRSAVFPEAGLVAFHSADAPGARSSLYFRASGHGTLNHAMGDNGSIVFVARGWPVLVNSGYYDSYGSPHHALHARHTRAKNALTVDGGLGQATEMASVPATVAHSRAAAGRINAFAERGASSFASADLAPAYRRFSDGQPAAPVLASYRRSIVYDPARRTAYIVDEADSAQPRTFELNFHTPQDFVLGERASARIPTPAGTVCLDVLADGAPGWQARRHDRFATSEGEDVAPSTAHARHRHLVLSTQTPSRSLRSVTVLREDCARDLPRLTWAPSPLDALQLRHADGSGFDLRRPAATAD